MCDCAKKNFILPDEESCKISMLWNWTTIHACFLTDKWHVKSGFGFAISCFASFFLSFSLGLLNKISNDYDSSLINTIDNETSNEFKNKKMNMNKPHSHIKHIFFFQWFTHNDENLKMKHHIIRCTLYITEWILSYIIMLLFMYFNGYIILSLTIGTFAGRFLFNRKLPQNYTQKDSGCCCK